MNKFFLIIVLFLIDFISKKIIFYFVGLNSFISFIPIMDITHIHNYGISFGLFSGIITPWTIIIISLVAVLIIIIMFFYTSKESEKLALILIISGAISNIIDRMINNYVLDFIYLHYKDFYWPAFNFADIYITFGVIMILYQSLKELIRKMN